MDGHRGVTCFGAHGVLFNIVPDDLAATRMSLCPAVAKLLMTSLTAAFIPTEASLSRELKANPRSAERATVNCDGASINRLNDLSDHR